jgi:hypothetical protein
MRNVIGVLMVLAAAACGSKKDDSTALVDPATGDTSGVGGAGGTEGTGGTGGDEADASSEEASDIVACGTKSCNAGEYCCDGTCGACVAIGQNCPVDPCGVGVDAAAE